MSTISWTARVRNETIKKTYLDEPATVTPSRWTKELPHSVVGTNGGAAVVSFAQRNPSLPNVPSSVAKSEPLPLVSVIGSHHSSPAPTHVSADRALAAPLSSLSMIPLMRHASLSEGSVLSAPLQSIAARPSVLVEERSSLGRHHHSSAPLPPTSASGFLVMDQSTSQLLPHSSSMAASSSSSPLMKGVHLNARKMDPFAHQERHIFDELNHLRRDPHSLVEKQVESCTVVMPRVQLDELQVMLEQLIEADPNLLDDSAAASLAAKNEKKASAAAKTGGPHTMASIEAELPAIVKALTDHGVIAAQPVSMRLSTFITVGEKLRTTRKTLIVPRNESVGEAVVSRTQTPSGATKKANTTKSRSTPEPSATSHVITLPSYMTKLLQQVECMYRDIRQQSQNVLENSGLLHAVERNPAGYSDGLSFAARDLCAEMAKPFYRPALRQYCSSPSAVPLASLIPTHRIAEIAQTYGRFHNPQQFSGYVLFGLYDAHETACKVFERVIWEALQLLPNDSRTAAGSSSQSTSSSSSSCFLAPGRLVLGAGWQRVVLPAEAAASGSSSPVTVILATAQYEDLTFTVHRTNRPVFETQRMLAQKDPMMSTMAATGTSALIPRQFLLDGGSSRGSSLTVVEPKTHPIVVRGTNYFEVLFSAPLNMTLSCSFVQGDAPPQTPLFKKRQRRGSGSNGESGGNVVTYRGVTLAKGMGPPRLPLVDPRSSSSTVLIDKTAEGLIRVAVRMASVTPGTLNVFSRQSTATSYQRSMRIDVLPDPDSIAPECLLFGLPLATEALQTSRLTLLEPRRDWISCDSGPVRVALLASKSSSSSFVVRGPQGETKLQQEESSSATSESPASHHLSSSHGMVMVGATLHHLQPGPLSLWADGMLFVTWNVIA